MNGEAMHVAPSAMRVSTLTGADALALLASEDFRGQWRSLHRECRWATVFQGLPFVEAWWRTYADRYEPVLLIGRRKEQEMCALLMLARERCTGEVLHVGTHHAEYHAWLAHEGDSDDFMVAAIHLLHEQRVCRQLQFMYLAPAAPLGWASALDRWRAPSVSVHPHPRGVRELDPSHPQSQSLRKKGTRSKLRRLQRNGAVEFRVLEEPEELQHWMPQIRRQCDQRHPDRAGTGPFGRDPVKERFFSELFATRGLLHASVLTRGDQLLASHLGLIDGDGVSLGLFTHDPDESTSSPGKLLLLMLSERLASDGFHRFDLTPGDAYKLRFANRVDQVFTVQIRFSTTDTLFRGMYSLLKRGVRAIASSPIEAPARTPGGLPGSAALAPALGGATAVPMSDWDRTSLRDDPREELAH